MTFFGPGSKIYNIHSLIHLPDDVRNFGKPLDDISAFDFENLLGKIKRSLIVLEINHYHNYRDDFRKAISILPNIVLNGN